MSEKVNCEVCKKEYIVGIDSSGEKGDIPYTAKKMDGLVCWSCYNNYMQKKNHTRMIRKD